MGEISCEELADLLSSEPSESSGSTIGIVDVRDEDFAGGHIKGAINSPSEDLEDDDALEELIDKLKDRKTVIFHCMKSQERGPTCARRFRNRLAILLDDEDSEAEDASVHVPTVLLLKGGFETFAALYANDAKLCENIDEGVWKGCV